MKQSVTVTDCSHPIAKEETVILSSKIERNGTLAAQPASSRMPGVYSRVLDCVTEKKFELLNLTERINAVAAESGIENGIVHIQSMHTTTAVFLNEWQEALLHDIQTLLEQMAKGSAWRHDDPVFSDCERKNAASHLRGLLLGQSLSLQLRHGRALLGTWQSIIFAELDGPRTRSLSVQVMGA